MSYRDEDESRELATAPDDPGQRRDSRRMTALDAAIRCKEEYASPDDVLLAATKFLAFLEGKLVAIVEGMPE